MDFGSHNYRLNRSQSPDFSGFPSTLDLSTACCAVVGLKWIELVFLVGISIISEIIVNPHNRNDLPRPRRSTVVPEPQILVGSTRTHSDSARFG